MKEKIFIFETADKSITLLVLVKSATVWLSANQMAELFKRDEKTIIKHIKNVLQKRKLKERTTRKKCVLMV